MTTHGAKKSCDKVDDPLFTILVGDPAVPFALRASAFQSFPGTYLAHRTAAAAPAATTSAPPSFPFAKPFEICLPDCPVAVFTRVVLPFYGIDWTDGTGGVTTTTNGDKASTKRSKPATTLNDWTVPGFNNRSDVPRREEDLVSEILAGRIPAGDQVGNEEGGDGDEESDELDHVSSAVIDRCLKFLLIPSPYDVPHALRFYTRDRELPALDRMLRVVQQQVEAHQSLLKWHEERKTKPRTPSEATVMRIPQNLDVEVRKHFRIDGLKREVSRLKRDAWKDERPTMDELYFAPQACRAADVEFRDPEAVKMMAELARHGLLDRLYFRRFDMRTDCAIHSNSCYNSRGRGDVGMESITPTLGDFVHPDKVVVVGDVDDLVEPLEGAKVYRSEDLKHVPKGVLQARPQDKTTFLFSHEWVSDSRYKSTESFDWPLASEDCWESYKCPAAIPTEVTVGIVFWNGDAASDDYKVPKRRPKLRVPTFFPKPMTAFQLFCHEKRSQLLLAAEESGCSVTLEEIENRIYDEWTRGGWRLREAFEFLVDLAAHSEKRFRRALGRHWRGEDMNEGFASGDETFEDDE